MTSYVYGTIIASGVVTWLLRVVPFIIVQKFKISKGVMSFLSFVPVAILTAIFVESLLVYQKGAWPAFNIENLIASVPTIISGVISKSLMVVVIVGVISMAVVRLIM
ncbi:branched-chain amino acid ABC transporter [Lentilactobacillus curieae]|uniref:Branched-chain amino acid ABC transporter n=1 Tax=Lentilactobacillus curieae TaxID=1138822 RepID=A0A1S6QHH2_9LACO|nr:AzlD domain-containing protein [Lentilactobacillus curieae]AQW21066.1 branched-chain amino acid ABC transporter [Lentilactobacillus curieae]